MTQGGVPDPDGVLHALADEVAGDHSKLFQKIVKVLAAHPSRAQGQVRAMMLETLAQILPVVDPVVKRHAVAQLLRFFDEGRPVADLAQVLALDEPALVRDLLIEAPFDEAALLELLRRGHAGHRRTLAERPDLPRAFWTALAMQLAGREHGGGNVRPPTDLSADPASEPAPAEPSQLLSDGSAPDPPDRPALDDSLGPTGFTLGRDLRITAAGPDLAAAMGRPGEGLGGRYLTAIVHSAAEGWDLAALLRAGRPVRDLPVQAGEQGRAFRLRAQARFAAGRLVGYRGRLLVLDGGLPA